MTRLEQKIVKLLADYPEREFYGQEIAEKAMASKASASILLKSLTGRGLVLKKIRGRMGFYRINQKSPELKKIRINSAIEKISLLLPKLKNFSLKIILFGSSSRGEQTIDSDLDLFILTPEKDRARAAIKKMKFSGRLNAVVKTPTEWSEMEISEPEFYREIKNGINLHEHVSRI